MTKNEIHFSQYVLQQRWQISQPPWQWINLKYVRPMEICQWSENDQWFQQRKDSVSLHMLSPTLCYTVSKYALRNDTKTALRNEIIIALRNIARIALRNDDKYVINQIIIWISYVTVISLRHILSCDSIIDVINKILINAWIRFHERIQTCGLTFTW